MQPKNRWGRMVAATSACFLAIALAGCGDDPVRPKITPDPPQVYLPPTSPQNVLRNLATAYVRRDSVATAAVYDDFYVGTSTDLSSPTPIPAFSKSDEVRHVGRLKRDPLLVSVYLDLGAPSSWQRLSSDISDPPGWAIIQINSWTVRIEDIGSATTRQAMNHIMEYRFKPAPSDSADTTWTVVRWTEFAN